MNFSEVLYKLKVGHCACRRGWNGRGMYISLQRPDEHSKMTLPYLFIKTAEGSLVPWVASNTDLLSEDWEIV